MLNYESTYAVLDNNETIEVSNLLNQILLLPEVINDIINKLKNIAIKVDSNVPFRGQFINGYCCLRVGQGEKIILSANGKVMRIKDTNIIISYPFFCHHAVATIDKVEKCYVSALTGEIIRIPKELKAKKIYNYHCGYAVVKLENDEYAYLGNPCTGAIKIASPENYLTASHFFHDKALVKTAKCWKLINSKFKTITSFPINEREDLFFESIVAKIDAEAEKIYPNEFIEAKEISNVDYYTFIDTKTGFSIFATSIIEKIANHFNLELPSKTIYEQLIWLVTEVAKLGNFIYDYNKDSFREVTVIPGIKISDGNNEIISFDEKDVALIKERTKKGK